MKKVIDTLIFLGVGAVLGAGGLLCVVLLISFVTWTWDPDIAFLFTRAGLVLGLCLGVSIAIQANKEGA